MAAASEASVEGSDDVNRTSFSVGRAKRDGGGGLAVEAPWGLLPRVAWQQIRSALEFRGVARHCGSSLKR